MKQLLAIAMAFGLLMPLTAYAQSNQPAATPPPVAPTLVREGDFATQLVTKLNLGTPKDEAEAESILTSYGIAPKNGWISDYPVTPDIIGELQSAVEAAADSNRLPMAKVDALKVYRTTAAELGLPITAEIAGKPGQSTPPTSPEYTDSSAINQYYADEGPPVVTYYPPPPDYGYLYGWVPYPFWCSGFFFPGFFVLTDFDIIVVDDFHHDHDFDHDHDSHNGHDGHFKNHTITNHFTDPKTHAMVKVDPTTRATGRTTSVALTRASQGFSSPSAKQGATAIFNRSVERERSSALTGTGSRNSERSVPGTANGRTLNQSSRSFTPSPSRNFSGPSNGFGRSFSPPSRSFSAPPMVGRGSFGGFHGGGFGGFHGGGFHR